MIGIILELVKELCLSVCPLGSPLCITQDVCHERKSQKNMSLYSSKLSISRSLYLNYFFLCFVENHLRRDTPSLVHPLASTLATAPASLLCAPGIPLKESSVLRYQRNISVSLSLSPPPPPPHLLSGKHKVHLQC